jgi:hypothetical protein
MIYLFKTHRINVSNLAQALTFVILGDNCLGPCSWYLDDSKFLKIRTGDFVNIYATPGSDFRMIDWTDKFSSLDAYHARAVSQHKVLVHGTGLDHQLKILKRHYGSNIMTIGINYQKQLYDSVLRNVAEMHVHRLSTGCQSILY